MAVGSPPPSADASEPLVDRMRRDLAGARRAHDAAAVSALRTALSALANAEAPPLPASEPGRLPEVPGPQAEVDRLVLSASDVDAVLAAEIADRQDTIAIYERHGRTDEAEDLRAQVTVLSDYRRGSELVRPVENGSGHPARPDQVVRTRPWG